MKKIYSLTRRWLLLLLFLLYELHCDAQIKASPDKYTQAAGQVSFIVHAPVVLPALLERRQYDTLGFYLQNWKNSNYPNLEFIFAMQVLLAIQADKYHSFPLPFDCLNYLSAYAKEQTAMLHKADAFRYYITLNSRYSYDATDAAQKTILFITSWSKELIKTRKLTTSQLFICRTLSGNITTPREEFESDPAICPDLVQVQEQLQACKKRYFADERNHSGIVIGLMAGSWFPTGNLQVLGVHPSIGFIIGWRNRLNEYDLALSYRLKRTTSQSYDYVRQGDLYTDNFYEGGYAGAEYTRYLVHTTRADVGLTSGIGYDYFSLVSSSADPSYYSYLKPFEIGSLNCNAGVRYKCFLRRNLFLGFVAKYNVIHYVNTGGTNLTGNAFTLDLTIGSR